MRFPSVRAIASTLKDIQRELDPADTEDCDVRLQVYPNGQWAVRWGLSDYDQDHRGFWGCSSVSPTDSNLMLRVVTKQLLEQVKNAYAEERG